MIWVTDVQYITGYTVLVTFNTGEKKRVDLEYKMKNGVFLPLKKIDHFKRFSLKNDTITWENGADIAPESLYERGEKISQLL
ncbi:MAG: DUF2442 domain-containing protein [Candidatus Peregrinibacteria bacterium]